MKISLYMRDDLNMRKGKMAAQASHAVMRRVLDLCVLKPNELSISPEHYAVLRQFANKPEIDVVLVQDEAQLREALSSDPASMIVDHGHTEFHGVHTPTCGALGLHSIPAEQLQRTVPPDDCQILARQWLVFLQPEGGKSAFDKVFVIRQAMQATVAHLYRLFKRMDEDRYAIDFVSYPAMKDWLFGAFGKIGLVSKDEALLFEAYTAATEAGLHASLLTYEGTVLMVGPEYPESATMMQAFKLL